MGVVSAAPGTGKKTMPPGPGQCEEARRRPRRGVVGDREVHASDRSGRVLLRVPSRMAPRRPGGARSHGHVVVEPTSPGCLSGSNEMTVSWSKCDRRRLVASPRTLYRLCHWGWCYMPVPQYAFSPGRASSAAVAERRPAVEPGHRQGLLHFAFLEVIP